MSNTQKKQAKRKARKKAARRHVHGPGCAMVGPFRIPNFEAMAWARKATEGTPLTGKQKLVAERLASHMDDTWEVAADEEYLLEDLATASGLTVEEVRAALEEITSLGVLERGPEG